MLLIVRKRMPQMADATVSHPWLSILTHRGRWAAGAVSGTLAVSLTLIPSVVRADQTSRSVDGVARMPPGWLATSLARFEARQQPPSRGAKKDSLKNGAVIGAIVGAAALGGFALFLCHALDDTGDP